MEGVALEEGCERSRSDFQGKIRWMVQTCVVNSSTALWARVKLNEIANLWLTSQSLLGQSAS